MKHLEIFKPISKNVPQKRNNSPKNNSKGQKGSPNVAGSGSSISTHLTARLIIRTRQNGEGQAFILENYDAKNTSPPNPKGREKGAIIQKGLTRRGRRVIRVISDCYNLLVLNQDGFRDRREITENRYNSYCRFITLTFRNIIPDDKKAKKLLDSFFKRLQRKTGHVNHYVWVAERQKRGAIHFHILTPEKIVDDSTLSSADVRLNENLWINRAWNEIVCTWAYRSKKITKQERDSWLKEYGLSESYYKRLNRFKMGEIKAKPRRPEKSKLMLLPNCVHVHSAGHYMGKYMSKQGQNIVGGMYDASTISRVFLTETDKVNYDFGAVTLGNEAINYMYHRSKKEGVYLGMWELEHNESRGVWCRDASKLLQWYYEFCELKGIF